VNNVTIEDLVAIVEPPERPVFVPTPDEWRRAEHMLGASFPYDYKKFIQIYGAGGFQTIWIEDQVSDLNHFNFANLDWVIFTPFNGSIYEFFHQKNSYNDLHKVGRQIPESERFSGERYEFGLFPDDGGILPIARNAWAFDLAWRCWKNRDWTIAYLDHEEAENEEFEANLTSYLLHDMTLGGLFPDGIRHEDGEWQKSVFVSLEINDQTRRS